MATNDISNSCSSWAAFVSPNSDDIPFRVLNPVVEVEREFLRPEDLKTKKCRDQYARWCNDGELALHKAAIAWRDKQVKKGEPFLDEDQAILRFLIGADYAARRKLEKLPPEFTNCSLPGLSDKENDVHYYADGTPVAGHTRASMELFAQKHNKDLNVLPKVWRMLGYRTQAFLAPVHTDGKFFELSATKCMCQWWKLAYSGRIPAETFHVFFNEATITLNNKGFVREEYVNLEENLRSIEKRYRTKRTWPYFTKECKAYVVKALELMPNAVADSYEDLCEASFGGREAEEVLPQEVCQPGKVVEIEEVFDEEPQPKQETYLEKKAEILLNGFLVELLK